MEELSEAGIMMEFENSSEWMKNLMRMRNEQRQSTRKRRLTQINNVVEKFVSQWHIIKCVVDCFVYFLCVLPPAFQQHFTGISTATMIFSVNRRIYTHLNMRRIAAAAATINWNQFSFHLHIFHLCGSNFCFASATSDTFSELNLNLITNPVFFHLNCSFFTKIRLLNANSNEIYLQNISRLFKIELLNWHFHAQ